VAVTQPTLTAERILAALKDLGFTHVVGLPDSEANFMYRALEADPALRLVQVCREGETMAIALGLTIGGKQPVCLIQNTGFFESGDSIRGLAIDVGLPMLLMIGYRGWRGGAPMTDSAGRYLEPMLRAWGIRHWLIESDADLDRIGEAWRAAQQGSCPTVVLIGREYA
jgi:sulfopyruvate decarboxylase TPP-binding subunit